MQLISFQIKECFGFRDSGRIDLLDPTNLIYVLGRNSAGKTSFLSALAHFDPRLALHSHSNFLNFDPSSLPASLICEYKIKVDDFSAKLFQKALSQKISQLNQGHHTTIASKEYEVIVGKIVEEFGKFYQKFTYEFIDEIETEGQLWVRRSVSGEYQLSTEPSFKAASERIKKELPSLYAQLLQKANQPNAITSKQLQISGNSLQPFYLSTPAEIESLLAYQLPTITWFNKAYSLLDTLPDIITIEHLERSPNTLTTTLIDFLGRKGL